MFPGSEKEFIRSQDTVREKFRACMFFHPEHVTAGGTILRTVPMGDAEAVYFRK
jgi:hypothetical protein